MKILISGGQKTKNIVSAIAKKFESSNDQFNIIEFLDDVNSIYSKGEYYDKAIITEQSITREYAISDEYEIRNRINLFADDCARRGNRQTFVFLAQSAEMANIISEEILAIERNSVVIYAKPPYSVSFFHTLIVNDINQIPSELIYVPESITGKAESNMIDIENENDFDVVPVGVDTSQFTGEDEYTPFQTDEAELNEASDIFGTDEDFGGSSTFGGDTAFGEDAFGEDAFGEDAFGNDNEDAFGNDDTDAFGNDDTNAIGDYGDFSNNGYEVGADNFGNDSFDGTDSFGTDNFGTDNFGNDNFGDMNNDSYNSDFSGDEFGAEQSVGGGISLGKSGLSLEKSNEEPVMDDSSAYGSMDTNYDTSASLEGWDDEPDYTQPQVSDQLYDGYVPADDVDAFDTSMYNDEPQDIAQNFNESNIAQSNSLEGFDVDDYGDPNGGYGQPVDNSIPNNDSMGFGEEDYYSNDNNQYPNNPMGYDDGMNPAMMAAGAGMAMGMGMANNDNMQQNPNVNLKKKGFKNKQPNQNTMNNQGGAPTRNVNTLKSKLQPFANKGNSIVVTGCGGCGTSTMAYSIANILSQLGYTVLLVDLDTEGRTQSYITKTNYDSVEPDSANLMSAINSSTGIGNYTSIVKEGFHLLTMGLGTDTAPVNELIHKEKISRFVNLVKTSYNFVVYDIPFNTAVGFLSEIVYMADNLVLTVDASNWGITKTMLNMCNIASDEMQDTMFNRAQFVFNKFRRLYKVFGKKVKSASDITKVMDDKVFELIGEDIGLHFNSMTISGIVNDTPEIEDGWFSTVQYSDTAKGQAVFLKLVEDIILNS